MSVSIEIKNATPAFFVRSFDLSKVARPTAPSADEWLQLSSTPLDLEIGCGVGWHPIRYATDNPQRRLIAIEHTRAKFERFRSRLDAHPHLTNLFAVHADAIRWVAHFIKPETVERCFLLYPNPEPKASNKRWMRSPFMQCLLDTLKPDGELILASNERWYIDEAREWAAKAWALPEPIVSELTSDSEAAKKPRTHFEKKYLARGQTCFDVRWRKYKG